MPRLLSPFSFRFSFALVTLSLLPGCASSERPDASDTPTGQGGAAGTAGAGAAAGAGAQGGTGATGGAAGVGGSGIGGASGTGTGGGGAGGAGSGGAGTGGTGTGGTGTGGSGAGGTGATGGAAGAGGGAGFGGGGTGGSGSGGTGAIGGGGAGGQAGTGAAGGSGGSGTTLHFVAYGDTRSNPSEHQDVVDAFSQLSPELVIHSGDLWDGYSSSQFRDILTKNSNIADLLDGGKFVVSRGNHEDLSELLDFTPSLTRGTGRETFSYTEKNSFFVVLGENPSGKESFLDTELQKPEAQAARWRFVSSHYPIYSGGDHGASGNPNIEELCDKHGVAIYFSGHDHIYERTFQMKGGAAVDRDDELDLAQGTVYIVSGGGGSPLYSSERQSWTRANKSALHFTDVVATDTTLTVKAHEVGGGAIDSFVITR